MQSWSCELTEFPQFIVYDLEFITLELQSQLEFSDLTPDLLTQLRENPQVWQNLFQAYLNLVATDLEICSMSNNCLNEQNSKHLVTLVKFLEFYEQSLPYVLTFLQQWQKQVSRLALTLAFQPSLQSLLRQELALLLALHLPQEKNKALLQDQEIFLHLGFILSLHRLSPSHEALKQTQEGRFCQLIRENKSLVRIIKSWHQYFTGNFYHKNKFEQVRDSNHCQQDPLLSFAQLLLLYLEHDYRFLAARLGNDFVKFFTALNLVLRLESSLSLEQIASSQSTWYLGKHLQILSNISTLNSLDLRGILAWQSQASSNQVQFRLSLETIVGKFLQQHKITELSEFLAEQQQHYKSLLRQYLIWRQQKLRNRLQNLNFDYQAQQYFTQHSLREVDFSSFVEQKLTHYQNSLTQKFPTLVDPWQSNLPLEVSRLLNDSPLRKLESLCQQQRQSKNYGNQLGNSRFNETRLVRQSEDSHLGVSWLEAQHDRPQSRSCSLSCTLVSKVRGLPLASNDINYSLLNYEYLLNQASSLASLSRFSPVERKLAQASELNQNHEEQGLKHADNAIPSIKLDFYSSLDFLASLQRYRQTSKFLTLSHQQSWLEHLSQRFGVLATEEHLDLQTIQAFEKNFSPRRREIIASLILTDLSLNLNSPWCGLGLTQIKNPNSYRPSTWWAKSMQAISRIKEKISPQVVAKARSGSKVEIDSQVKLENNHKPILRVSEAESILPLQALLPQLQRTKSWGVFTLSGCLALLYQETNQQSGIAIRFLLAQSFMSDQQDLIKSGKGFYKDLPQQLFSSVTSLHLSNSSSSVKQSNLGLATSKEQEYALSPLKLLAPHAGLLLLGRENQLPEANNGADLVNLQAKPEKSALATSTSSHNLTQEVRGLSLSEAFVADSDSKLEEKSAEFNQLTAATGLELGWLAKLGIQLSELDYQQIGFCFIYDKALNNSKLGWENKQLMRALQDALLSPVAVWNEFVIPLQTAKHSPAAKPDFSKLANKPDLDLTQCLADPKYTILDLKLGEFKPNLLDLHQASFKPELVINQLAFRTRIGYLFWQSLLESLQQISQALVGSLGWEFVNAQVNFKAFYLSTYSLYHLTAEEKAWLNFLEEYYQQIISTVISNNSLV